MHAQDLWQTFSSFGSVTACHIQRNQVAHGNIEALVRMDSVASASRAVLAIDACKAQDHLGSAHGPRLHVHFFDSLHALKNSDALHRPPSDDKSVAFPCPFPSN